MVVLKNMLHNHYQFLIISALVEFTRKLFSRYNFLCLFIFKYFNIYILFPIWCFEDWI